METNSTAPIVVLTERSDQPCTNEKSPAEANGKRETGSDNVSHSNHDTTRISSIKSQAVIIPLEEVGIIRSSDRVQELKLKELETENEGVSFSRTRSIALVLTLTGAAFLNVRNSCLFCSPPMEPERN
jgi:hypothetical protein